MLAWFVEALPLPEEGVIFLAQYSCIASNYIINRDTPRDLVSSKWTRSK